MHEKKSFAECAEKFLSGKGFYIVLFVCIAVIGVSAWLLMFSEFSPLSLNDDAEGSYVPAMVDADAEVSAPTDLHSSENDGDGDSGTGETTPPEGTDAGEEKQSGALTVVDDPPEPEQTEKTDTKPAAQPDTQIAAQPEPQPEAVTQAETSKTADEPEDERTVEDLSFIWPLVGSISVPYSPAALIYDRTMGDWRTHSGVDIAAPLGTKVVTAADGTVTEVYKDVMYGTTVVIDHGAGVRTSYSNLMEVPTVSVGDSVTLGSVIGAVGDTALCETGEVTHLHFSVTVNGESADPGELMP